LAGTTGAGGTTGFGGRATRGAAARREGFFAVAVARFRAGEGLVVRVAFLAGLRALVFLPAARVRVLTAARRRLAGADRDFAVFLAFLGTFRFAAADRDLAGFFFADRFFDAERAFFIG
jgi:hypothetical protein